PERARKNRFLKADPPRPRESRPNDIVQQQGGQKGRDTSESRHARPVCCNGWFGGLPPLTLIAWSLCGNDSFAGVWSTSTKFPETKAIAAERKHAGVGPEEPHQEVRTGPRHGGVAAFGGIPAIHQNHDDAAEQLHASHQEDREDDGGKRLPRDLRQVGDNAA